MSCVAALSGLADKYIHSQESARRTARATIVASELGKEQVMMSRLRSLLVRTGVQRSDVESCLEASGCLPQLGCSATLTPTATLWSKGSFGSPARIGTVPQVLSNALVLCRYRSFRSGLGGAVSEVGAIWLDDRRRTRIAHEAPSCCSHRHGGDIEPKVRAVCRYRTGIIKPGCGFVR